MKADREQRRDLALDNDSLRAQLERILASPRFQFSRRYPALLRYVVEQTLNGATDVLKERTIGVRVFKRHPEYDTSADPVVRTTASEVRKRIEEYYSDPGHDGELRIVLPVGTYVPEFRASSGIEHASPPPVPVQFAKARNWKIWVAAALLLLAAGLGTILRLNARDSALHRFWAPVLTTSPVLVVVETLMGFPKQPSTRPVAQPVAQVQELLDPKLYLTVNQGNARLAAYFGANGRSVEYELARNVTVTQLRTAPFILKGAFNNPLTWQAVSSFRYFLKLDRTNMVRQIVDRRNPSQHWDSPMAALSKDYALIARAPEPRTGQMMVVIAGLGEQGGAAATEFLTNPKYMQAFAERAAKGWEKRNLEIVLETDLTKGDWGEPKVVASEIW